MSRRTTPFISVVVQMMLLTLENRGERMDLVNQLMSAHQENNSGYRDNTLLDTLRPDMRQKLEPVLRQIDSEWQRTHQGRDKGGYVNLLSAEAHAHLQDLAEKADHVMSNDVYEHLPDVRRRRILEEIHRDLHERNIDWMEPNGRK